MRFCEAPEKCSMPVFSTDKLTRKGYCRMHANRYRTDLDRRSIIQKAMSKQKKLTGKIRGLNKPDEEDKLLELWFIGRRHQMVGYCTECSKLTFKNDDKKYKWSIAHICQKSLVPSVATHYHNWIELCWQCHSDFDSTFDKAMKMNCFQFAKDKFQHFKHIIPNEELRKVNPHLIN